MPELQTVAQVSGAVREVKASASQRVRVCDHLDPMDRLEVDAPDADQQELLREANYAQLKGGSPREGSVCLMGQLAAMHVRAVSFRHEFCVDVVLFTSYGRLVQKSLFYEAPHNC